MKLRATESPSGELVEKRLIGEHNLTKRSRQIERQGEDTQALTYENVNNVPDALALVPDDRILHDLPSVSAELRAFSSLIWTEVLRLFPLLVVPEAVPLCDREIAFASTGLQMNQ